MKTLRVLFTGLLLTISLMSTVVLAADNSSKYVYRLYNDVSKEHLFTTYAEEVRALTKGDWIIEGYGWESSAQGEPVYRLYNPITVDHLYTGDQNEINTLTAHYGWVVDFGAQPVFYSSGSTPVYRAYCPQNGRHHLTTDVNEYNALRNGWNQENVAFTALSGCDSFFNVDTVKSRLRELKERYPQGREWGQNVSYTSPITNLSGSGCHAFALMCSDKVFENASYRKHGFVDDIRVGDLIRVDNNSHSIIVLDVDGDTLTLVEGNVNNSIMWGRKVNRNSLNISYIITRYPA